MALRRLAANRNLFSSNLLRSVAAAPSATRSFNHHSNHPHIPPSSHPLTSPPFSFSRVFDPLAAPTRNATQSQLMNQQIGKCNPLVPASGIVGIGQTRSISWAVRDTLHFNMYTITGTQAEMMRSFSSSVGSPTETSKTDEKIQANANIIRPLSPHLPVYKPQTNSVASIFNRISAAYLAAVITTFYLFTLKLGLICFTFYPFYKLFFITSKLALISAEVAALALAYHLFHSLPHLFSDFSAVLFLKRLGRK